MKILFGFFIFCIVLFIYLHIQFHLKTSNDLEVYEVDDASKDKLEELCDVRQPVIFDFDCDKIIQTTNRNFLTENYQAFEIKVRNINDLDYNSEIYMPLALHASVKLFNEDKNGVYYSENNGDFLQETGVVKNMQYNDPFLRPSMLSNCNYDIMMGSENTITPFRYEINYRNFFLVTQGSVQVKLAPPNSSKYLYTVYDYANFEFRSSVNPWAVQAKYIADFDKMKCLDVILQKGQTIHIPAYWWYSIKFGKDTSLSCFHYRTYMNNLAITPYIGMHALQVQNTKVETAKKIDIKKQKKESSKKVVIKEENNTYENADEKSDENKIE